MPTVAEFSKQFMDLHARVENKPSEIASKEYVLRTSLLPLLGSKRLVELRPYDILSYRQRLRARMCAKSVNIHLSVLRTMLNLAEEWEVISQAPRVRLLAVLQREPRFLSAHEVRALLSEAELEEPPWHAMVTVAIHTGLRVGELRALEWSHVSLLRKELRVQATTWSWTNEVVSPKSKRNRSVPLNRPALAALKSTFRLSDQVFGSRPYGALLGYAACKGALKRMCTRAKIKHCSWHTLRHTCASHLVSSGVPLKAVQELLGHASINTTLIYAHLAPHVGEQAVKALEALGEE